MNEHEERIERLRGMPASRRTLLMQTLVKRAARQPLFEPIPRVARDRPLVQSFAQQRLWYLDLVNPGDSSYNMPECVRLTGSIDLRLFRQCANEIVARHEVLRTAFDSDRGQPVQLILPHLELDIEVADLSAVPAGHREQEARKLLFVHSERPFDLRRPPLIRLTLFRLEERHHFLLLNLHHIVSDGWSTGVFIREFTALYEAGLQGSVAQFPPLEIQYADYAAWQRGLLDRGALRPQIDYWTARLSGVRDIQLPVTRARPAIRSTRGGFQSISSGPALALRLKEFAHSEGATLFILLAAAFKSLLRRYSGQEDITFGFPIAGRSRPELEPLIGLLANTAVLRTIVPTNATFREALRKERDSAIAAYQNQTAPFEKIVEIIQPARSLSRNPIFQVMFILQNTPMPPLRLPGLEFEMLAAGTLSVKFDILFELYETARGLDGWMGYSADLFDDSSMEKLASRFVRWLDTIIECPDSPLDHLPLDSVSEIQSVLEAFNEDLG